MRKPRSGDVARAKEIFARLAKGWGYRRVARDVGVSSTTVRYYKKRYGSIVAYLYA